MPGLFSHQSVISAGISSRISKVLCGLALCMAVIGAPVGIPTAKALDLTALNNSIVTVHVYKGGTEKTVGTGTIVSDLGDILTSSALIKGADDIKVSAPGGAPTSASLHRENHLLDIAVLSAPGLDVAIPTTIAQGAASPGDGVIAVMAMSVNGAAGQLSSATGTLGGMGQSDDGAMIYAHNAAAGDSGLGGPLVNGCGELVSMNRAPVGGSAQAASFQDLVSFMNAAGVDMRQTTSVCTVLVNAPRTATPAPASSAPATPTATTAPMPAMQGGTGTQSVDPAMEAALNAARDARVDAQIARQQANAAEQVAGEAEARLVAVRNAGGNTAEAEALATQAREQASAAASYAAQLEAIADQKDAQVSAIRNELKSAGADRAVSQEQAAEQEEMLKFAIGGAALIAILAIGFILFKLLRGRKSTTEAQEELTAVRRRTPRAEHAAASDSGHMSDIVLSGLDSDNQPLKIKISAKDLQAKASVIVGRSPSHADVLINDPEMSRAHAAVRASAGGYMIEDMGSTNGTMVNGAPAGQGNPVVIRDGDSIFFGSVKLKVELL